MTGNISLEGGKFFLYLDPLPKRKAKLWPILFAFIIGLWFDASIHHYEKDKAMKEFYIRQDCVDRANEIIKNRRKDFARFAKLQNSYIGIGVNFNP